MRPDPKSGMLSVSHPRPSAMIKACGLAEFSADIKLQGAAELAAVRSTEHHVKIRSIDTAEAEKMPGVIGVMTAKDILGINRFQFIFNDQPVLCDEKVRCLGDLIAVVAVDTLDQAPGCGSSREGSL